MRSVLVIVASCWRTGSRLWQSKLPRCESWQGSISGAGCRQEDEKVYKSRTDGLINKMVGRLDERREPLTECQQTERAGIWFPFWGCFHFDTYFKLLSICGGVVYVDVCGLCVHIHAHGHHRSALGVFLHLSIHCLTLCMSMLCFHAVLRSAYHMSAWCPQSLEDCSGSSGTAVSVMSHLLCGCWEQNPGPLREQQVLLTIELSLQLLSTLVFEIGASLELEVHFLLGQ